MIGSSHIEKGKVMNSKLKASEIICDWNGSIDDDALVRALRKFGVYVTSHPACEGTDARGFIFSNRPLTVVELSNFT